MNEMIRNLKDTTAKNTEQDWLKTNLAKFTRLLQGQRDLLAVPKMVLSELSPLVTAQHGVFYLNEAPDGEADLKLLASYGYRERKHLANRFREGEGLVGQCAFEKQRILLTDVPDDYIKINSGLGEATPANIVVLPVLFEGKVKAVVELASFHRFSEIHLTFLDQLTESIGIVLNTIEANMRTEELLKSSQSLTQELTNQQEELQKTNARLEQQAALAPGLRAAPEGAAGGAAADQRGAGGEGPAPLQAERRGREQEPADRAGQAGARGEGRAALADVEVQVGVPRQHVARAADPAEQPADPVQPALAERRGQPDPEAGRVRPHDPLLGGRPAGPDQRDPRPGQDRVGDDGGRRPPGPVRGPEGVRRAQLPPGGAGQGARLRHRARPGPPARDRHRPATAPAGAAEPAVQRPEVHRAAAGSTCASGWRPRAGAPAATRSTGPRP